MANCDGGAVYDSCSVGAEMTGYQSKRAVAQDKLVQPAQEPVACIGTNGELMWLNKPRVIYNKSIPLYIAPPQRPWVPLTDEELKKMVDDAGFTRTDLLMIGDCVEQLANLVEATLRSKNT